MIFTFLVASIVLAVTPGPGVFYVITRTLSQGKRGGLVSVAGVAIGNFGNALFAAILLAGIFAVSSWAFVVIKYAGAAYLIYMGIAAWRNQTSTKVASDFKEQSDRQIFKDGFFVALLNHKTTVFYTAFLPQFMRDHENVMGQTIFLGFIFVITAALTDATYVMLANQIRPDFASSEKGRAIGRYVTGAAFVALGLFTAFVDLNFG